MTARLGNVFAHMEGEIGVLRVETHPQPREAADEKTQREYYLNEQLKAIQKLGEGEDGKDEAASQAKIKAKFPKEARERRRCRS